MRDLIVTAVVFSLLFIPGCYSRVIGGPSVVISAGVDYSTCDDDEEMVNEDLMYVDRTHVGFWLSLPYGGWVFRCRSAWYDTEWAVWRYGPWYNDHSISYTCHCHGHYNHYCPFHGMRFHAFMSNHYPTYHHKHFGWYYNPHHKYYKHYYHGGHNGHGHGYGGHGHGYNGHGHGYGGKGHGYGGKGHGYNGHGHGGHGFRDERNSGYPERSEKAHERASLPATPEPRIDNQQRPAQFDRTTIIRTNEIRPAGGGNGEIHKVDNGAGRVPTPLGSNNPIRRNNPRTQLGNR